MNDQINDDAIHQLSQELLHTQDKVKKHQIVCRILAELVGTDTSDTDDLADDCTISLDQFATVLLARFHIIPIKEFWEMELANGWTDD